MRKRSLVKPRETSPLRWMLILLVIADGFVCGIVTHLFFSSLLPSVRVALADSAPTAIPLSGTSSVPVSGISSFELISRKGTQVPMVMASNGESFTLLPAMPTPVPTPSPTLTAMPVPTSGALPTAQSLALAISVDNLPKASTILPPCGPGEEFFRTVDGRGYDATFSGGLLRGPKFHAGIDGSCKLGGQAKWIAYAVADSRVIRYEFLAPDSSEAVELWSSGWTAVLAFTFEGAEYEAIYGHLAFPNKSENWPKVGDRVGPTSPLGRIGSTGASSGLHLHFGLRRRGVDGNFTFVNPEDYQVLGKRP